MQNPMLIIQNLLLLFMRTTALHELPSASHIEKPYAVNDGISSAAIADKVQYDYYDGDTAAQTTE